MFQSRFFAGDSDSSSDESDEEAPQAPRVNQPKWASSDDEDEKRVVRSKDDKQRDEMMEVIVKMKNRRKNNDWVKVEDAFDELNKVLKTQNKIEDPPRIFIKALSALEDAVKEAQATKKDLKKDVARSLSTLQSKIRKCKTKVVTDRLAEYKSNPNASGEEELTAPEPAKEAAAPAKAEPKRGAAAAAATAAAAAAKKEAAPAAAAGAGSGSEEESDWGEDDESDESDEEVHVGGYTAADFLKKPKGGAKDEKDEKEKEKKEKIRARAAKEEDDEEDKFETAIAARQRRTEKPLFGPDEEVTPPAVMAKLEEILGSRGRKGTSAADQMATLQRLRQEVVRVNLPLALQVKLLLVIIAAHFDDPDSVATHMNAIEWHACHDDIMELLVMLINDSSVRVDPSVPDEQENFSDSTKPYAVRGSLLSFVERLDEEFTKALQAIDPHTTEYVDRLKDEGVIYNLICVCERYVRRVNNKDELSGILIRRVEHIYYKRAYLACPARHRPAPMVASDGTVVSPPDPTGRLYMAAVDAAEETDISKLVARLCTTLYATASGDRNRIRTRAMLCHVYNHAIFDRWFQARDLMLMSHLQESISHADPSTQILYNRTMVQLGLCAFRNGMIQAAHSALNDVFSGGRVKELLAQGIVPRKQEKTSDELKNEKKRQVPFHMHINTELLECVYYVTSMLLEIPHMAEGVEIASRVISKPLRRQLDFHARQIFSGPPEHTRDHVITAALAMKNGDWRTCEQHILPLSVWNLCPNADTVRTMLKQRIREESLRTYLFAFSGFYDSLSLATLSTMFDLSIANVHSVVSKMIINEELQASHDQPTSTIVIHKAEASPLQTLALNFADKVSQFVESNERLLDAPSGQGFKDRQGGWQPRNQRRDGGAGGRGYYRNQGGRSYGRDRDQQQQPQQEGGAAASEAGRSRGPWKS